MRLSRLSVSLMFTALAFGACGGNDGASTTDDTTATDQPASTPTPGDSTGRRLVSADVARITIDSPPADLVILDVRTPEEFSEGHIEGAILLNFYREDFADRLAGLDRDVPYVLYCRSGNRSGQTLALMAGLDFDSVQDVDGGILAWQNAGLPVIAG